MDPNSPLYKKISQIAPIETEAPSESPTPAPRKKREHKPLPDSIAHILSLVFSPMLTPTYGVAIAFFASYLAILPWSVRLSVIGIVFIITGVIPMTAIWALWRFGYVKDPGLNNRSERTVPYIVTLVCYLVCAFYLYKAHAPEWLWSFPAGGAIAIAICMPVNFRWKISGHMAGMGGIVAVAFRIAAGSYYISAIWPWLAATVILAGCIATSRIILGRHTLMQTIAGFAVGFTCVYILSAIV